MTRVRCSVLMLCTCALPVGSRAQTCLGVPVQTQAAADARVLVAEEWVGAGARVVIAPGGSLRAGLDGELLRHDNGANGAQVTGTVGLENGSRDVICAYASGSLFRRDADPDGFGDMTGRSAALGIGLGHWIVGRKVDVLLHAAGEGVVMRRDRTGDGAFVIVLGGGLALRRWFFGAAWKSSTPYDVLLTRNRGRSARMLLHVSADIGR